MNFMSRSIFILGIPEGKARKFNRADLELGIMGQQGGLTRMYQHFGEEMDTVILELNETLAA